MKKDFSFTGKAFKKMLESNAARSEECNKYNSRWKPGALRRLKAKKKKEEMEKKK
jgi:hypothetical protein